MYIISNIFNSTNYVRNANKTITRYYITELCLPVTKTEGWEWMRILAHFVRIEMSVYIVDYSLKGYPKVFFF